MSLSDKRRQELEMLAAVLPLTSVDLSSPYDPVLGASDSSPWATGGTEAEVGREVVADLAACSNFKRNFHLLLSEISMHLYMYQ